MKKVAPLRYGVVFKKAFCDLEIFTAFVRDFLDINLEIDEVETEKEFDPPIGRVKPRFDLFAEDTKNRVIVDIQHVRYPDHYDRFLHYHCAAMLELIQNAKNYRPDTRVYTLVVLTSGDRHKIDISTIDFDPKDLKGNHLGEIFHKIIYVCPKYVNEDTPEPYREWMRAIEDSLDREVEETDYRQAEVRKIFELIEADKISPEERARMFDEYNEEEKKKDDIEQKFKKGIEQGKLETAKAMLAKGMDTPLISELTGLSEAAILKIS